MSSTTWRINGFDTGGHDLELSALLLFDAAGSADAGAALTSSHVPIAGTLADLVDGDAATTCRFAAADVRSPGFFIQWVLPAERDVSAVRLGAGFTESTFPVRFSIRWRDATGWVATSDTGGLPWPGVGQLSARQNFDPHWNKVTLLLRAMDATDSTRVVDLSTVKAALSPQPAVKPATAPVKFGPRAIDFGTSGSNSYIRLIDAGVNALAFQSKDFTLETWCYFSTANPTSQQFIYYNYLEPFTTNAIFYGKHASRGGKVVFWPFNYSASAPMLEDPTLPPQNEWLHYAVCRHGSTFTLRRNGAVVATATFAGALTAASVPYGFVSTGTASFIGFMEDFRVTLGVDRYANDEPIPAFAAPPSLDRAALPLGMQTSDVLLFAKPEPPLPPTMKEGTQVLRFRDTEFGGNGRIYGFVERKNAPANVPLVRRVRLHRSRDGLLARETWSKPDGSYEFNGIAAQYEYDTIAWDHELSYRSVVANNLKPEVS